MKKVNSYILSKHKNNLYINLWKKRNNNINQIKILKQQDENPLSLINSNEAKNNKKLKYLIRNFSSKNEYKTLNPKKN